MIEMRRLAPKIREMGRIRTRSFVEIAYHIFFRAVLVSIHWDVPMLLSFPLAHLSFFEFGIWLGALQHHPYFESFVRDLTGHYTLGQLSSLSFRLIWELLDGFGSVK
jgi:hypothetical protein